MQSKNLKRPHFLVRLHIQNNEPKQRAVCKCTPRDISFSGNPLFFCIPIRTFTLAGCFAVPGFDTGFLAVLRAGKITFFIRAGFGATFGFGLRTCPISLIGVLSQGNGHGHCEKRHEDQSFLFHNNIN
ncbi:invasion associated locus B family protein [Alistipes indistinctus]|uniref:hypothetical protein n=1 Tax=Alistipes indistinctus TaxID=626932 RepID=UPI0011C7EC45|nr:hypothetical protein [Alistipes indistinctus]UWN59593.1 hypothetical protein NQ495_01140 [Alistipes indistinctus YIT 12060]